MSERYPPFARTVLSARAHRLPRPARLFVVCSFVAIDARRVANETEHVANANEPS